MDKGKPLNHIASVASFFLSRIDAVIDPKEEEFAALGGEQAHFATKIRGQVAISSAKIAYQIYKESIKSERFIELARKGASPQRLLWASTRPKNPDYNDTKYIEALIGPDTINTIPLETLEAYRDHGDPASRLESDLEKASWVFSELSEVGIDIKKITETLENNGVEKFIKSFNKLMDAITKKSS
jgi:transaldolase